MTRINPIDPIYRNRKQKKRNDQAFLGWLRTLPSAIGGGPPCEACHYRTAANSGVGIKPLYSAIPLTSEQHRLQHQIGQYNFRPREWWEEKVKKYVTAWNEKQLRTKDGQF